MIVGTGRDRPTEEDLARARSRQGGSMVVSREILGDLDTPVSAYLKLRRIGGASFLLQSAEGGERIGRYSFVGARPRRVLRVKDGTAHFDDGDDMPCDDPLEAVQAMVDAYGPALPPEGPFEGGALGYLSYEAVRAFERRPAGVRLLPRAANDPLNLPDAAFMDVDTLLIFDHIARRARIVSHAWLDRPPEEAVREATARIDALQTELQTPLRCAPLPPSGTGAPTSNVGRGAFEEMVRRGKEHIRAGDILQIVLSQRLSLPLPGDSFGLYRRLRTVSPSPYMYFLDFGDHQIIGASPELLVQVKGDVVTARPIAGTRPRGRTPEEDEALGQDLLADEKERAEHLMLVDLARNDVGRVSAPGTVQVTNFMVVEQFSHVMHLVSDVTGRLRDDCTAFDALRSAFPAGTVSGAPKIRAMQIIADLEPDCRGPYAGAVGFVNSAGDMEMAITIRTGVAMEGMLHLQVGAGIVADSVPENEFRETMNKARALLEAAGGNA